MRGFEKVWDFLILPSPCVFDVRGEKGVGGGGNGGSKKNKKIGVKERRKAFVNGSKS